MRRESQAKPRPLSAPVYPRAVCNELKRVLVAFQADRNVARLASTLGMSTAHARTRLRVARLLPAGALDEATVPKRTWKEVQRDRQVAFWAQEFNIERATEIFEITRLQVRRAVRRVRGLFGDC